MIASRKPGVLSRVINLETGSLAVEAALKMMLARFYSLDGSSAPYAGRIPVFLVMGGPGPEGSRATTTAPPSWPRPWRGLWPEFTRKMEDAGIYRVVSVPINDAAGFRQAIETWNTPPCKTAGFCHEIIMMNYGAIRLEKAYLQAAYRLCRESDTPVLCDEIQSCAWYEGLFLFRQYGLAPDSSPWARASPAASIPPAALLLSGAFDILSQFGALVTNGQEELASPGLPDHDGLHRGQRARISVRRAACTTRRCAGWPIGTRICAWAWQATRT